MSRFASHGVDSPYAVFRLVIALLLSTIGGVGMYAVVVVLPAVQADFGIGRSDASLPFTATMIGFGIGGMLMGWLSDRFGIMLPVAIGAVSIAAGFSLAGHADGLWSFVLAQGLIGLLGSSATFSPLMADTSLWFERRRGIAVAVCASGNYLAGTVWPPVVQHLVETIGWRQAYVGIGLFCVATMLPLALLLRRRPPAVSTQTAAVLASDSGRSVPAAGAAAALAHAPSALPAARPLGVSPATLQTLLIVAGVACCVAMSMPQVHIVALCGDLGYGPARGAEMLSLMLGLGIISRLASGVICDRIGGLRTLLLGSVLQGVALLMYLPSNSLMSLYLVSALFGLFQGGIVPSYAIIVREHFAPAQAGTRISAVITATLFGMALGGWLSGKLYDLTGSYQAAFVNGIAWNMVNVAIVLALLYRSRGARLKPTFGAA
ncbi:MAG TPA: MFS transporter [Quisquiliibacterium sp.]|nr:MFS transporter [Quisquiliibacterium sp.]